MRTRPVFRTFQQELKAAGADALKPLERVEIGDGPAATDEVNLVVANRAGAVLSAATILKSDFFSNLQKMSLPEWVSTPQQSGRLLKVLCRRIDGSPNFRRIPLVLGQQDQKLMQFVCGSGMPTAQVISRMIFIAVLC